MDESQVKQIKSKEIIKTIIKEVNHNKRKSYDLEIKTDFIISIIKAIYCIIYKTMYLENNVPGTFDLLIVFA
jgi:hypothetical protein